MSHQVVWTHRVTKFFEDMANLNPTECHVLESRIAGMTHTQIGDYYGMSVSTVDRIVKRLKQKYDIVQKEYPDDLKPRKYSAEETYQDTN